MKKLNYATLAETGYDGYILKDAPEKVIQFGEGNFLRAFVDYWFDLMNEKAGFNGKVVLVQPIAPGLAKMINEQEGLYTLFLRGFENGQKVNAKRVISSVSRCLNPYEDYQAVLDCAKNPDLRFISCNTTEAGIAYDPECKFEDVPASSYPGKLTQFLYERFKHFGKEKGKGFIILSCELIDNNGKELEKCVLQYVDQWNLGEEFKTWVEEACVFTATLVDRIVTGYPRATEKEEWEKLGYEDHIMVTGEPFALWVIESDKDISKEFDLPGAGLPVVFTDDHHPYKQRKVRILNGAHTSFVLASWLCGNDIVRQSMEDKDIRDFMNKTIFDEVIPTLTLPEDELKAFAAEVVNRFNNPYVDHALLAISLNSVSKWRARCLPSLLGYVDKFGKLPAHLTFSIAALMAFYCGDEIKDGALIGNRNGESYNIKDDMAVLEFFRDNCRKDTRTFVENYLGREDFHGQDLNKVPGLTDAVTAYLDDIKTNGMRAALCRIS